MIMSNSFFVTKREFPNDEETISSKLLVRSGMIYKNGMGLYSYLPIGLKLINNVEKIIRDEMKKIKAEEVLMPSIVEDSIFNYSNRKEIFGNELFGLSGKNNKKYYLCPTHEELFALMARNNIRSYKDLHFSLFQISSKFRDEDKTNCGINRKKEFLMADAYSFDTDSSGLDISYDKMFQAFRNIFNKFGLSTFVASNDADSMFGDFTEEFHVQSDTGTDKIVKCSECGYCTNLEYATPYDKYKKEDFEIKKKEEVYTPNIKSIKDLCLCLNIPSKNIIKSLIIKVDESYKMILLRGCDSLNIYKLNKLYKNCNIEILSIEELERIGAIKGYVGPIKSTMEIIADNEVKTMKNVVCGANKKNYHYINVNPGIDFRINRYADLKVFNSDSLCPRCKSKCNIINSIEVGQIYKLGTSYSENFNLRYLDEVNELNYVHMGSYGIGIDRCIDAIVSSNYDDKGIIWPYIVSPYKVAIVISNINDEYAYKYAKQLYEKLEKNNIDTILDDRKESIGVKLNDMDLIGIPLTLIVGNKLNNRKVEIKYRHNNIKEDISIDDILDKLIEYNKSHT